MSCDPIIDGAPASSGSGLGANIFQVEQFQTTLAGITGKGVATPTGFWDFNEDLVEKTVGGAGRDMAPNATLNDDSYSWVDGQPNDAQVTGLFLTGDAIMEVDSSALWRLATPDSDMSISLWYRQSTYDANGIGNAQTLVSYVSRSSATIGATTVPTYILFLRPAQTAGAGTFGSPYCAFYDSALAYTQFGWTTAAGKDIRIDLAQWTHLGYTRVRNGVNDVDHFMYLNGRLVSSLLAQNDTGQPSSAAMRLQVGARENQTRRFGGTVRGMAIWNSQISTADMLSMYELGRNI